ncbi:response regulator receiver and Hpt phospho transfer protein [Nitritalea halalkaliphila LW7]|uniref:Response regulator receiver and Hpt phospho transfer protein n=1 Tax=Nitritalea halalkaliphila LW7 TaxID=1189621 RepID=I5C2X1_9BACT|nr:response regulator [Nitritalea halalkaliphila]EIM76173.1 response regulator receiver and Hpt phospho transfer protein [Nitritalea halalkaliphila LW7]
MDGQTKKILIVDDNLLNRKVFEHIVGQLYEIRSAEDGQQAVDMLREEQVDLVLMDIQMPVMDGITALGIVQKEQLTECPIIAVSAFADESDKAYFLSTGFHDFIPKPIKPKVLLECIAFHLAPAEEVIQNREAHLSSAHAVVLDEKVWQQLLKYNSEENIRMVYFDFVDECERLLADIEQAVAREDFLIIGEKLHIIKGNSGTLGATDIFIFAKDFENSIKKGIFDKVSAQTNRLKEKVEHFKQHLTSTQNQAST